MSLTRLIASSLFALLFVCQNHCIAQTTVSDEGVFTSEELSLKECSFDKTADAVILFDQATSNYDDDYHLVTERRIRFKILKEKGIERGNIHIYFYSKDKFEYISHIKAVVSTPREGGTTVVTSVDQKSIYTRKLNERFSEVVFAMPNVKVGSIIEYEYQSTMEHYGGLQDWYFQQEMPVMLSSYKLYIIPNASFNYVVRKASFLKIDIQTFKEQGSVVFEMKNVPGLRDEAYSTSYNDYLQKVSFQLSSIQRMGAEIKYSNNWRELNREFIESREFGRQMGKDLPGMAPVKALWAERTNAYDKMKFIYDYVRSNFEWDGVSSFYPDELLKNVIEKKKGNSAELNLLLINLLKDADIEVYPLLVSERSHGKVDTAFSFMSQFNKVVAFVNIDDKTYVLDATDAATPVDMIPANLLNTIGFLVDKKNYRFIHLTDNAKKKTYAIQLNGSIDANGMVKCSSGIDYYDYARIGKASVYNSNKQRYIDQFAAAVAGSKVDSFNITGLESDSIKLHHDLNFEYPLTKSGSYYFLNYNLFTGYEKNPFIADYRFTDIDFGTRSTCVFYGIFSVPDQFVVDALPKNMVLKTPDNELKASREVKKTNNIIEVNLRIDFSASQYDAQDYDMLKAFFSQMVDMLNEPVVLKAK